MAMVHVGDSTSGATRLDFGGRMYVVLRVPAHAAVSVGAHVVVYPGKRCCTHINRAFDPLM